MLQDELDIRFESPFLLRIEGVLRCQAGTELHVLKLIRITPKRRVKTFSFSYHAQLTGPPLRPIFRYDNAHTYEREGHGDAFHKHQFDPNTWREIVPPQWIGYSHWPTLRDVLEELEQWTRDHSTRLAPWS